MKLSDFVDINPRTTLAKGADAEFVPMEALDPKRRYVKSYPKKKYSGGTKFVNGDTLFARITPCLENGKIAQFVSDSTDPAFGSTEYWILRAKEGVSDPSYVYYLAKSDLLRKPAEKSMVGASGRQRAQIESIQDINISNIDITDQQKIAAILTAYDDLIENNSKRIEKLESMARLLYRKYVDSPEAERWKQKPLINIAALTMGQSPKSEYYNTSGDGLPFHQGVTNFGVRFVTHKIYSTGGSRIAEPGDILFSVRAPVGQMNLSKDKIIIGRGLSAIRHNQNLQSLLWEQLKAKFIEKDMMGNGTIFASVTKKDMENIELLYPPVELQGEIESKLRPIHELIGNIDEQNRILIRARDLLLPRLMSGEIEV